MNKQKLTAFAVGFFALLASSMSHAALPAEVATFFTTMISDFGDLLAQAYPAMIVVVGGMILLRLVKRVGKTALSG